MKNALISILRDKKTDMAGFRNAAQKMANILACEAIQHVKEKDIKVQTKFQTTQGSKLGQEIVLVPILRAGIAFLPAFLSYFENATVGFMGLKRNEKTAIAKEYYKNFPQIKKNSLVIILDPMIATGGSAVATLKALKKIGVKKENILFVSLIAAPEGLDQIDKNFPKLNIIVGVIDKKLNKNKFILPGIGDFGDRYFGTERR